MEQRTRLQESISEIRREDFRGEWKTDIYIDPEAGSIYTYLTTGGVPGMAYAGTHQLIVSVKPNAIAESVYDYLIGIEDKLQLLLDCWSQSSGWTQEGFSLLASIHCQPVEIAQYWNAGDWLDPVIPDLKRFWVEGKTAEEIIDLQGCGNEIDGMCDRQEAIAWLESKIKEWEDD